jgi:hypothetical protein
MADYSVPPTFSSTWPSEDLAHHRSRIQTKLRTFLPPREAQETATQIYRLALDTQEEIARIMQDPLVDKLYLYDGQFFTARHMRLFHTAFDGLHVLQSLSDSSLETFFRGGERRGTSQRILDAVGMHAWIASLRRMNWEEFQTLGLVPPALLEEALLDEISAGTETGPPAMSIEEQIFFQSFERQLI